MFINKKDNSFELLQFSIFKLQAFTAFLKLMCLLHVIWNKKGCAYSTITDFSNN